MATAFGDIGTDVEHKPSVVAGTGKQTSPEVKQVKQTVPVPRTKWVKRYLDMPKQANAKKPTQSNVDNSERLGQQQQQLAAVEPQAALPNQQTI